MYIQMEIKEGCVCHSTWTKEVNGRPGNPIQLYSSYFVFCSKTILNEVVISQPRNNRGFLGLEDFFAF